MPDLLTPQTIASAGPILLDTLFRHVFSHKSLKARSSARGDDLMYDEAFVLMKTFLESATKYPLVSLQRFSNVPTPSPPWVGVHRISIPPPTLQLAAKHLVTALGGPEMAYKIAGGSRWWQVRAGGLEGEWIAMKRDYEPGLKEEKKREKARRKGEKGKIEEREGEGGVEDDGFRQEMDEMRCMLYIHGGAYYWGSINTHRYTIWRYARKMRGRCFAVNYRKAPQYPFPCAIQDILAAYLYLTHPPPDAPHKPVKPEHIVIAGDSAGGGLVLALLQILRDVEGLEMCAGAALISPWSDLTHSFPSILSNTATDIVPPYSFIHKPSSLWPPPPMATTSAIQSGIRHKIRTVASKIRQSGTSDAETDVGIEHDQEEFPELYDFEQDRLVHQTSLAESNSHAQASATMPHKTLSPGDRVDSATWFSATPHDEHSAHSSGEQKGQGQRGLAMVGQPFSAPPKFRSSDMHRSKLSSFFKSANATLHPTTHHKDPSVAPEPSGEPRPGPARANPAESFGQLVSLPAFSSGSNPTSPAGAEHGTAAEQGSREETGTRTGGRPTTLANCAIPLRLEVHGEPVEIDTQVQIYATNAQLCHPLVSPAMGYLGGLCPLFVMCGDNEVLRDEILYLAHKAANPDKYPVRDDIKAMMLHYEGIEERYSGTKVHLQVYDGVCHDLPLFSMCRSARGVFRAISTFARYVTPSASSGSGSRSSTSAKGSKAQAARAKTQPLPGAHLPTSGGNSEASPYASDVDAEGSGAGQSKAASYPIRKGVDDRKESRRGSWWMSAMESMTPGKLSLSRRTSDSGPAPASITTLGRASASGTTTPALQAGRQGGSGTATPEPRVSADLARPITGIEAAGEGAVPLPLPLRASTTATTKTSSGYNHESADGEPRHTDHVYGHGGVKVPDLAHKLERLDVGSETRPELGSGSGLLPHGERTVSPMTMTPSSTFPATRDGQASSVHTHTGVRQESGGGNIIDLGDDATASTGTTTRKDAQGPQGPQAARGTGDESGPRWVHESDWDQPAKEGEAGHPGVYARENAWHNNMIRERVSSHGILRPLEPASELGALQMPTDEIGMIKEGPALRYLTGQYLWDKKYKHARKKVAQHRQRNLRAHAKDVRGLVEGIKRKLGGAGVETGTDKTGGYGRTKTGTSSTQESSTVVSSEGLSRSTSGSSAAETVSDVSSIESEPAGRQGETQTGGVNDGYDDWSWAWALDGDVPPPSAIVSRRDTAEARKLALTADHSTSPKTAPMSGLSIWVAMTTFFSSSSERNRAKAALQAAKAEEEKVKMKNAGRKV